MFSECVDTSAQWLYSHRTGQDGRCSGCGQKSSVFEDGAARGNALVNILLVGTQSWDPMARFPYASERHKKPRRFYERR